jgi:hypothetical protein
MKDVPGLQARRKAICDIKYKAMLRIRLRHSEVRYGSVSGSGSGSFYHEAKIVRKTLIAIVLLLLYDFVSLKNDVNLASKRSRQKNLGNK